MTLQTSGPISILDIANEFGGSAPHSLSEYYKGGGLVPSDNAIFEPGPDASVWEFDLFGTPGYAISVFTIPSGLRVIFNWADVFVYDNVQTTNPLSIQSGIWTYHRQSTKVGSSTEPLPDNNPPGSWPVDVYRIRRDRLINVNIPTSDTISLEDFYGAEDV